jgi:hypothetical protein
MTGTMDYRLLADLVLVTHALLTAFIILGLVVIVAGAARQWMWVRNPWFRFTHLAAITVVVLESWVGWICPLTEWESRLREAAGGVGYRHSFIADWLHEIMFYDIPLPVFTALYTGFGILVLLAWFLVPPRYPRCWLELRKWRRHRHSR